MNEATPPVLHIRSAPLAGLMVSVLVLLVSLRLLHILGSNSNTYLVLLGMVLLAAGLFIDLQAHLLFLLAPLLVVGGRWGDFGEVRYSLGCLLPCATR